MTEDKHDKWGGGGGYADISGNSGTRNSLNREIVSKYQDKKNNNTKKNREFATRSLA